MAEPIPDATIAKIYGAAVGKISWTEPLIDIANHLGLWCLQVIGADTRKGIYHFSHEDGQPPSYQATLDYVREYHARNPRVEPVIRLRPGEWMHDHETFTPEFIASEPFFRDFQTPHGGGFMSSTIVQVSDREIVAFSAIRPHGQPPLNKDELDVLGQVRVHLAEALKVREHLRERAGRLGIAREILDRFEHPMLLMDPSCAIVHRNPGAASLLETEDAWIDSHGYLIGRHGSATLAIRRYVAAQDFTPVIGRPPPASHPVGALAADGTRVVAFLSPIRHQEVMHAFGPMPLMLVVFHDPRSQSPLDALVIREAFAMTPAEARLCVDLAAGRSLDEIAERRQVAITTVKTQLRAALDKAGVTRQRDLVGVLSRIPALGARG